MMKDLERLLDQARDEVRGRDRRRCKGRHQGRQARPKQVEGAAGKRVAASATPPSRRSLRPTACAAGRAPGSMPITAYDKLTAAQVKTRLGDLSPAELRKVRDHEKRNKAARASSRRREAAAAERQGAQAAAESAASASNRKLLPERLGEQLVGVEPLAVAPEPEELPASGSRNHASPKRSRRCARQRVSSAQARR